MPMNYRGRLVKKVQQADKRLLIAMFYLAEVERSLRPQHEDRANAFLAAIQDLDYARHNMLVVARCTFLHSRVAPYDPKMMFHLIHSAQPLGRKRVE